MENNFISTFDHMTMLICAKLILFVNANVSTNILQDTYDSCILVEMLILNHNEIVRSFPYFAL